MSLRIALATLAVAAAVVSAHADSLTLDTANSSNGTYRYTFNETNVAYIETLNGGVITITGLSGVTGASSSQSYLYASSFTSTSASFAIQGAIGVYGGSQTDLFTVTSSVLTLGTAQYSIPSSPVNTGNVQGPVAAATAVTPEPSSLLLLGTGLLGAVGAARRRFV